MSLDDDRPRFRDPDHSSLFSDNGPASEEVTQDDDPPLQQGKNPEGENTSSESDLSKTCSDLSDEDLTILHAAMAAMTQGIHACQSNLSEKEWDRAEEIWEGLDDEINSRAPR
jgi:hypothetical protein